MTAIKNSFNFDLPIVFSADDAAEISEKLLYRSWVERNLYELTLPVEYFLLDPGDVIQVTVDESIHNIRITNVTLMVPDMVEIQGVADSQSVYSSAAIGGISAAGGQVVSADAPTHFVILDIPALRDSETSSPGFYVASCGYLSDWSSAVLYKSLDGGTVYNSNTALTRAASIGIAVAALPDSDPAQWDTANSITINMINGELASDTVLNVLNWQNVALLGNEIVQWRTATLNTNGSYTISGLLRGRRGTEWAMSTHELGDRFVVLSDSTLFWIEYQASEIGQSRDYKAVTIGRTLQDSVRKSFTGSGANLMPYSPTEIEGSRDGLGNLTFTWKRRSRLSARSLWSPVLGEDAESYEVDIMSGNTVLRIIPATGESASYSSADQVSDGLVAGNPVEVNIYQLSATVGRGYAENQTI